jgi:hypothetical protein
MGWFTSNDLHSPERIGKSMPVALLAIALLAPLQALALDHAPGSPQRLSDEELRRVSAQGLVDHFLFRVSRYSVNGLGIEVLGDMATLLNPLGDAFVGLIDADISFKDAVFNPNNPSMLINQDGSALVRLPDTVRELNLRNMRIRGSNGTSFGSVTIRDLNYGGTTIRVTQH